MADSAVEADTAFDSAAEEYAPHLRTKKRVAVQENVWGKLWPYSQSAGFPDPGEQCRPEGCVLQRPARRDHRTTDDCFHPAHPKWSVAATQLPISGRRHVFVSAHNRPRPATLPGGQRDTCPATMD